MPGDFQSHLAECLPGHQLVNMTLQLGQLILTEASLSFLGIGIEPPGAAWGSMVQ